MEYHIFSIGEQRLAAKGNGLIVSYDYAKNEKRRAASAMASDACTSASACEERPRSCGLCLPAKAL